MIYSKQLDPFDPSLALLDLGLVPIQIFLMLLMFGRAAQAVLEILDFFLLDIIIR